MLYIFHGSDIIQGIKKSHSLIDSLRAKRTDASFVSVDADHWNASVIDEHIGGQGLFSRKYIIFLDRVTENADAREKLIDFIPVMKESANIFIVLEGKLGVELAKAFEKQADKVVACESGVGDMPRKPETNIFALADAVGTRDSFKAWSIYRQAIDGGTEPENILGTLFWQVKSMILAANSKTASEAGLNPFVFGKSKRYAGNFKAGELNKLAEELVTLYHEGHRGAIDMESGIEELLLKA